MLKKLFLHQLVIDLPQDFVKHKFEQQKEVKKQEVIFATINKNWSFNAFPSNQSSQSLNQNWAEWRVFLKELSEKPKTSIGAFQKKSSAIAQKAIALNNNIPEQFNKQQIKSRISVLITKIKMMDLYIHLDKIPDEKVVFLIGDINKELVSLERQMDKIVERSKVPKEQGEEDFLKMLDTTRAIPNASVPIDPNLPRVE